MIPAKRAQIEWRPPSGDDPGDVRVVERRFLPNGQPAWPYPGDSRWFCSEGACWDYWRAATGWKLLCLVFALHNELVVADGLDPEVVEREFLKIREYRTFKNRGLDARIFGRAS